MIKAVLSYRSRQERSEWAVLSGLLSRNKVAFLSASFTILFHFGSVTIPKMGVEKEENRAEMFSSPTSPGIK